METAKQLVEFVKDLYRTTDTVPLHAPSFLGNEKSYLTDCVDSTFVSSVGKYVDRFEKQIESFTGSAKAVATTNGTAALHAALYSLGVGSGDIVVTQALTFVATCNAISYLGAEPVFVDVAKNSCGLCPDALERWLVENALITEAGVFHKDVNRQIKAVVPMHTLGHPVDLHEILRVCKRWNLYLVEDAAESLGSYYRGQHTGTFGDLAALSFNGNKIITTGGGGMILCSRQEHGVRLKHITTTAKLNHAYDFFHDEVAFNYRLPNINAALGCAQMERLADKLKAKRRVADGYRSFFASSEFGFIEEPDYGVSNYWLNAVICSDREARDTLLALTNKNGIMTRPLWTLMHKLPMFSHCERGDLTNSEYLEARVVCLPSSPIEDED